MNVEEIGSFDACTFPATSEQLIAECGETELALANGTETIADVLARLPEQEFASAEGARRAVYGTLGDGAIGRRGYSDRDPTCPGETGHDPLSL